MYRIWSRMYERGELVAESVSSKSYVRKGNAERAAKAMFAPRGDISFRWTVSKTNPFIEDHTKEEKA